MTGSFGEGLDAAPVGAGIAGLVAGTEDRETVFVEAVELTGTEVRETAFVEAVDAAGAGAVGCPGGLGGGRAMGVCTLGVREGCGTDAGTEGGGLGGQLVAVNCAVLLGMIEAAADSEVPLDTLGLFCDKLATTGFVSGAGEAEAEAEAVVRGGGIEPLGGPY